MRSSRDTTGIAAVAVFTAATLALLLHLFVQMEQSRTAGLFPQMGKYKDMLVQTELQREAKKFARASQ